MFSVAMRRCLLILWVTTWTLWLAATLTQDQCVLETAQSLVYPPGELYGYGNSGLYRTYGVTVHVKCTFTNTDNAKRTVLMQIKDQNHNVLNEGTFEVVDFEETLVYKVTDLKTSAGYQYTCHCSVDNANVTAIQITKIPSLFPCEPSVCKVFTDETFPLCYENIPWPNSFKTCSDLHSQLQSLHWNDGAPLSRIYELNVIGGQWSSKQWIDVIVQWSAIAMEQGLCVSRDQQIHKPIAITNVNATCDHYYNLPASLDMVPYGRAIRTCYTSFLHSSIPMQLNGRAVYVGAIYYILDQETAVLRVKPGYEPATVDYDRFECTMYSWREGTDIQDATNRRLKPNFESNTTSKGKTWNINGRDIPSDPNVVMIACTHKSGIINESFPLDMLFEGQQVEFFVIKLTVVPQYSVPDNYINRCSVMKGRTKMERTNEIELDDNNVNCKCKFQDPIVACNPIKTVLPADNYSLWFPCYGPVTTVENTTKQVKVKPSEQHYSNDYIWIIVGIGLGIIFFVLLIYVTHLNIQQRKMKTKTQRHLKTTADMGEDNWNLLDHQGENMFFQGCNNSDPVKDKAPAPVAKSTSAKK